MAVSDLVGAVGTAMIITAYFRIQSGRTHAASIEYSTTNGIGAAFVLVSLWFDFNLASFILEVFWLTISIYGVTRARRHRTPVGAIRAGD